jgi:hypothetical protein
MLQRYLADKVPGQCQDGRSDRLSCNRVLIKRHQVPVAMHTHLSLESVTHSGSQLRASGSRWAATANNRQSTKGTEPDAQRRIELPCQEEPPVLRAGSGCSSGSCSRSGIGAAGGGGGGGLARVGGGWGGDGGGGGSGGRKSEAAGLEERRRGGPRGDRPGREEEREGGRHSHGSGRVVVGGFAWVGGRFLARF